MSVPQKNLNKSSPAGWFTGTGLTAGLAGIVASSCCVLPLVLAGFGLGGVSLSLVPALAVARPYLLGAAVLALAIAWIVHLRARRACATDGACADDLHARRSPWWLVLATAVVLLALVWQASIEPQLLQLFN
jgi:mercuric ion transport protein